MYSLIDSRRATRFWGKSCNLIKDCLREPFSGIGKPETLKENLAGLWSRRIDKVNASDVAGADQIGCWAIDHFDCGV